MSVLINGMELPNNCTECPCLDDEYFLCKAVNRQPEDENIIKRRPDFCPLIELPPQDNDMRDIGDLSDGYHTFNGLYYQRMVLFAALVNAHKNKAWKSWKHEDGEHCFGGGWFIVGIDTPEGSYTYHYEDRYWDHFECKELPVAKHWDGHTEEDVVRLLSLVTTAIPTPHGRLIDADALKRKVQGDLKFVAGIIKWINQQPTIIEAEPTQSNAPNTLKALTNADSIRSMTDEEMAEWMAKYCERKTVFCPNFGAHDCQESCEQCWLDWLRTEVTE